MPHRLFLFLLLAVDFIEDPNFGHSFFSQHMGSSITILDQQGGVPHEVLAQAFLPVPIATIESSALTPHFTSVPCDLEFGSSGPCLFDALLAIRC